MLGLIMLVSTVGTSKGKGGRRANCFIFVLLFAFLLLPFTFDLPTVLTKPQNGFLKKRFTLFTTEPTFDSFFLGFLAASDRLSSFFGEAAGDGLGEGEGSAGVGLTAEMAFGSTVVPRERLTSTASPTIETRTSKAAIAAMLFRCD